MNQNETKENPANRVKLTTSHEVPGNTKDESENGHAC